jgi:hypothetical protein
MDFDALLVTMRAGGLGRDCHHLYSDRPVGEPFLVHTMELGQVSWHQYDFVRDYCFCGMLLWQGWSSVT